MSISPHPWRFVKNDDLFESGIFLDVNGKEIDSDDENVWLILGAYKVLQAAEMVLADSGESRRSLSMLHDAVEMSRKGELPHA